jgi:hypothetical protein
MNELYELWTKPANGGRFTFSSVRGSLKECVAAIEDYPRCHVWFRRIDHEPVPSLPCAAPVGAD